MQTKLTLRLDEALIDHAKRYARSHNQSVSQLVANFFEVLAADSVAAGAGADAVSEPTPRIVAELHGCLAGASLDERDYRRHLEERYL